jgi:hypothetical protein
LNNSFELLQLQYTSAAAQFDKNFLILRILHLRRPQGARGGQKTSSFSAIYNYPFGLVGGVMAQMATFDFLI